VNRALRAVIVMAVTLPIGGFAIGFNVGYGHGHTAGMIDGAKAAMAAPQALSHFTINGQTVCFDSQGSWNGRQDGSCHVEDKP
jgi:hypothetical protein